ncbi:Arm DNA-binding domain-containing protein [Roseateles chitinivorans]|uniref:Arm DNA-binding domain-containing protein n=1 Tax=Roseateles chitinivorans TaxID=2917965 RepID=UPI0034A4DD4F
MRLSDAGSLYLEVAPSGSKRWFWKYRFFGKESGLCVGFQLLKKLDRVERRLWRSRLV